MGSPAFDERSWLRLPGEVRQLRGFKNGPEFWRRAGVQFPRQADFTQSRHKILTEKNLGGSRRGAGLEADGTDLRGNYGHFEIKESPSPGEQSRSSESVQVVEGLPRRTLSRETPDRYETRGCNCPKLVHRAEAKSEWGATPGRAARSGL